MADIHAISQYTHLRQARMPRTSREAGLDHLPIERSAPLRAWCTDAAVGLAMLLCLAIWFGLYLVLR